jgi:protein disulfide-isomerase A6
LPNIFDSNAAERNGYISTIANVAKKNRRHPFVYFWLQSGDQMDLERQLNLGFGFPALVAISPNKSKFGVLKGSFNQDRLADFLSDLLSGRVSLEDIKGKIVVKPADKWDGQDAKPIEEVRLLEIINTRRSHTAKICEVIAGSGYRPVNHLPAPCLEDRAPG